jgi:2-keto-myo-inositol isomerase
MGTVAAMAGGYASVAAARSLNDSAGETMVKEESSVSKLPWSQQIRYCLNTSTVRGHQLTVPEQIDLCARAGYDAIEPWIGDLRGYVEGGGTLRDLRKRLDDAGITVESAIGFAQWIVDDPAARAAGLEQARSDMALLAEIGGKRIAAPPIGAHQAPGPALPLIAERYRDLLVAAEPIGVVPELELWGFSKTLSQLAELAYVATAAAHPQACVLPDVYHIYKGGSSFASLGMIEASRMPVFHINDYPSSPARDAIGDRDRVFPGDGVAPLKEIFTLLANNGFAGVLSLELFNEDYWKLPADEVAATGLRKMREVVASVEVS